MIWGYPYFRKPPYWDILWYIVLKVRVLEVFLLSKPVYKVAEPGRGPPKLDVGRRQPGRSLSTRGMRWIVLYSSWFAGSTFGTKSSLEDRHPFPSISQLFWVLLHVNVVTRQGLFASMASMLCAEALAGKVLDAWSNLIDVAPDD